jgi:hypothetical protein
MKADEPRAIVSRIYEALNDPRKRTSRPLFSNFAQVLSKTLTQG